MNTEIQRAVQVIHELSRKGPVALVFSDAGYSTVLGNWLRHAQATGFGNIVVCALDDRIAAQMDQAGIAHVSLSYSGKLDDLWSLRHALFTALCNQGVDFIHSDADAVWLRNPVERLLGQNADLAFSQGTIWPHDIAAEWGFVLCCGLFAVRGGGATGKFFEACMARAKSGESDQTALNRLLRERGIVWRTPQVRHARQWEGRPFYIFDETVTGATQELTVALLPHAEFPRLAEIGPEAYVAHPLAPKKQDAKIEVLNRLGLWM